MGLPPGISPGEHKAFNQLKIGPTLCFMIDDDHLVEIDSRMIASAAAARPFYNEDSPKTDKHLDELAHYFVSRYFVLNLAPHVCIYWEMRRILTMDDVLGRRIIRNIMADTVPSFIVDPADPGKRLWLAHDDGKVYAGPDLTNSFPSMMTSRLMIMCSFPGIAAPATVLGHLIEAVRFRPGGDGDNSRRMRVFQMFLYYINTRLLGSIPSQCEALMDHIASQLEAALAAKNILATGQMQDILATFIYPTSAVHAARRSASVITDVSFPPSIPVGQSDAWMLLKKGSPFMSLVPVVDMVRPLAKKKLCIRTRAGTTAWPGDAAVRYCAEAVRVTGAAECTVCVNEIGLADRDLIVIHSSEWDLGFQARDANKLAAELTYMKADAFVMYYVTRSFLS